MISSMKQMDLNAELSEDESPVEMNSSASKKSVDSSFHISYLPDVWNDDVRMNALFTDFRSRNLNPAAYDGKMKFWMDLIERCVLQEDLITFSVSELRDKFQRKGRKPQGLSAVLQELRKSKRFVTMEDFFSASQESWISWGFDNFIKKPLWWSANYAFGMGASENHDLTRFVYVDLVKSKSAEILDRAQSGILPSSAIDFATFKEIFGDLVSEQSVPLILKHLQRSNQIIVTDLEDAERATIKFLQHRPNKTSSKPTCVKISDADRGVIALRKSLQKMEKEVCVINRKIEEADVEVRNLLRAGKKPSALRALKRKKMLEKGLAQKDIVVTNIENMLFRLENSESEEKIFEAYKAGLSALKKVQQDINLEEIEGVTNEIQESMDIQTEIAEAISSPTKSTRDAIDEDELEKELRNLLDDDVTDKLINELEHLKVPGGEPGTKTPSPQSTPKSAKTGKQPRSTQLSQV